MEIGGIGSIALASEREQMEKKIQKVEIDRHRTVDGVGHGSLHAHSAIEVERDEADEQH